MIPAYNSAHKQATLNHGYYPKFTPVKEKAQSKLG